MKYFRVEENGKGELIIKGVEIAYANRPTLNNRYFPEEVLKSSLDLWKKVRKVDKTYNYILINHPRDDFEEDIRNIAGWIIDMYYDDENKALIADFKVLPFTQYGMVVYKLLKNGYPIGVSLRGKGKTEKTKVKFGDEEIEIDKVVDYLLKGFDFVIYPAFLETIIHIDNNIDNINTENNKPIKEYKEDIKLLEKYISSGSDNDSIDITILKRIYENLDKTICDKKVCLIMNDNKDEHYKYIMEKSDNVINIRDIEKIINNDDRTNFLNKNFEGGKKMGVEEKDINILELKKEKLEYELLKLENDYRTIQEKVSILERQKSELEEYINKEKVKKEIIEEEIRKLNEEKDRLLSEKEKLENTINELVNKIETLEKQLNELYEKEKQNKVVVKFMGKVWDENNRPKIRIVDVSEKISTRRWGEIDKPTLRKMIWLSNDEKVMRECFALLDDGWKEDWTKLKYPHHELVKSDDPDYDFDLVLNVNGLRIAVLFMLGRAGLRLTPRQKRDMAKHFLRHYEELYNLGKINRIPFEEALRRLANTKVMFKVNSNSEYNFDAEILENILNELLFRGYIDIDDKDILEDINEKDNSLFTDNNNDNVRYITINDNEIKDVYRKLVRGLIEEDINENVNDNNRGNNNSENDILVIDLSRYENVNEFIRRIQEQSGNYIDEVLNAFNTLYNILVYEDSGEKTAFAQKYSIDDKKGFLLFLKTVDENSRNGQYDILYEQERSMILTFIFRRLNSYMENNPNANINELLIEITNNVGLFYKNLALVMSNIDKLMEVVIGNTNNTNTQNNSNNMEEGNMNNVENENTINTNMDNTNMGNESNNKENVFEKVLDSEGNDFNKNLLEEQEMKKLNKIIDIINEHLILPNEKEANIDNIEEVIKMLVENYVAIHKQFSELQLENKIMEKKIELVKKGVPEDVIDNELDDVEDEEELQNIYEKLIKTYVSKEDIEKKLNNKDEEVKDIFEKDLNSDVMSPKRKLTDIQNSIINKDNSDDSDIKLINV